MQVFHGSGDEYKVHIDVINSGKTPHFRFEMAETPVKVYPRRVDHVKKCRLCLSSANTDRLINVLGKAGEAKGLDKKILFALGFEVTEDDVFPAKICRSCETRLNNFYDFKVSAANNQNLLKKDVQVKRCRKPSSPIQGLPKQKAHISAANKPSTAKGLFPPQHIEIEDGEGNEEVIRLFR